MDSIPPSPGKKSHFAASRLNGKVELAHGKKGCLGDANESNLTEGKRRMGRERPLGIIARTFLRRRGFPRFMLKVQKARLGLFSVTLGAVKSTRKAAAFQKKNLAYEKCKVTFLEIIAPVMFSTRF